MISINIRDNFPEVRRQIDAIGKQARFAAAVALTRTAQDAQLALREEMRRVFDRPTPFTINSLFLKRATKVDLTAVVWLKESAGRTAHHYLMPNIRGGSRQLKRFEEILLRAGYMKLGERAAPGDAVKLDRYGNMSAGLLVQILSQLRAFRTVGGTSPNATNSARSRAKRRTKRYFVSLGTGVPSRGFGSWSGKFQHLRRGVWMADEKGVHPVLMFVSSANYKARFEFFKVAEEVARRQFPVHFEAEMTKALRTAR